MNGRVKGQLSAEMLLLIVVIIAIIGIAATQLLGSSKNASETIKNSSNLIVEDSSRSLLRGPGEPCSVDNICESNRCLEGKCE